MSKGVLLLALGSPLYGQMAFNAAMSLKADDPNIKIALFYTKGAISTLKKWHLPMFDMFFEVPEMDYTLNGKTQYQICKLRVYDYSPFDETLYLDVDMLWCKGRKVSWLMGELTHHEFAIGCGSYLDVATRKYKRKYQLWGNWENIIKHHNITSGKLWETWSAIIFFKKVPIVKQMFDEALKVYMDDKAPCYEWANGKPDEYCINIAMNKVGLNPHQENYVPIYCGFIGGRRDEETIKKKFWGFGFTGNRLGKSDKETYNKWVNQLSLYHKILDRFYHVDKKAQIPERLRI